MNFYSQVRMISMHFTHSLYIMISSQTLAITNSFTEIVIHVFVLTIYIMGTV